MHYKCTYNSLFSLANNGFSDVVILRKNVFVLSQVRAIYLVVSVPDVLLISSVSTLSGYVTLEQSCVVSLVDSFRSAVPLRLCVSLPWDRDTLLVNIYHFCSFKNIKVIFKITGICMLKLASTRTF